MIQLEKINFSNHKTLPAVLDIYEKSFPNDERRPISNILRQIDYNSDYNFFVVLENDFPVGMASVWVINQRFIYIEHLCVEESRRSKGIGSKAMNLLKDKSPFPIIIEVEKRLETMSEEQANNCDRRLKFYNNHGFVLSEKEYIQPPYTPTLKEVPMNLMEANGTLLGTDFDGVKNDIYKAVYKK
ncbi:MAG: GNAT family N-acetyltransferase [bacterium]|nr:GNAT family N-acetyltransferase [Candidatus Minthenecus merdequi]